MRLPLLVTMWFMWIPLLKFSGLGEEEGYDIFAQVGGNIINTVSIQSQDILKKVALNPQVFWCYQYFSKTYDPDMGKVLFGGDNGDNIRTLELQD